MRIRKVRQTTPTTSNAVNEYSTSTEDTYCCDFINKLLKRTVLYENENGTSSTITLSENVTNFKKLDITLDDNKVVTIEVVNGSTYCLQKFTIANATTFRTFCTSITINNNTVTFGAQYLYDHSGYCQEFTGIKIKKIVGYN